MKESSYRRNVLTLMSGSAIAQALPIAASPILTRLYTPDDFGLAALFLAIAAVAASVANGRYELAIGLPESDEDAINIAALGAALAVIVSALFLVIVVFFGKWLAVLLQAESIAPWLYLIPVSVLLTGIFNVLNYTNNRIGKFKDIAAANLYKSLFSTATQLGLGLVTRGSAGLITGGMIGQLTSNLKLYRNAKKHFDFGAITCARAVSLGRRYQSFPKYSMWSGFFNTSATNAINFLMPMVFGLSTLGFYNMAMRILGTPATLISSAFGQVFLREATLEKQKTGYARTAFNKTVKRLTLIGAPIFIAAFFLSEPLFSLVFGEQWRIAGTYAAIMSPLLFIRFVVSSLTVMNVVFEKNHIGFYWQLILVLLSVGLVYTAHILNWSFSQYLHINTAALTAHYMVLLAIMFTYNRRAEKI
ncbi:lipopolysaccharide biosynthesis protein [Pigmentiphaga kullae]|uniref:O-antigen/teichoic acid export membrane protein n=1 Tax=Pigmentiphaga kullae TaxID=151784 RepID=A0A4Q7NM00_9BURK|nr:oligosaccharide flippase family protein [Pigmentiphaga kullae]RZS85978.1 O-antigen/teichoic acid export membrane protein [Pigmentiphaga kullae]